VILNPLVQRKESSWFKTAGANSANLLRMNEACFRENLQVLADGGESNPQRGCQ
jgi:hypothetical protein